MELDIDAIHVTVDSDSDDDKDREELSRTVPRHILEALEELSRSDPTAGCGDEEYLELDLREIDWESESDRTGKLVQLLRKALEEVS